MSLGLLGPALLGLLVLGLGPVLAHLTRQEPRERRAFGAMLLLDRLERNPRRRRRLRDLLLLILRILAIALLVLAVAEPELRLPAEMGLVGGTGRVIIVLDDSLSMDQRVGGEPAFAKAQREAAKLVRSLPEGTNVAVITAGVPMSVPTGGLSNDLALVATLIEARTAGFGATDLHAALTQARELLGGEPGEVLVYTDESGQGVIDATAVDLERLLATGSRLLPRPIHPEVPANVVPVEASYGDGVEGGAVTVKLLNYGTEAQEVPTTVSLPDGKQITSFVSVPAADETAPGVTEAPFTVPRQAQGGVAKVSIEDASLTLDNGRWFHLPDIGASRVLVVDGDPGSSPTRSEVYFLERALAPWGTAGVTVDVVAPTGLSALATGPYRVAWLANLADPAPAAPALIDFVRKGGGLVLSVGDNVTAERWNSALSSLLPAPLARPRDLVSLDAESGEPLAIPDATLDLFTPFTQNGLDAFRRVRQRRVITTGTYADGPELRTLLRTESGVPLLIERKVGTGRVLLWTSTLDLGWGNAPLQAVYAPLAQRITGWLGGEVGGSARRADGEVGQPVQVPLPEGVADVEVRAPDGATIPSTRSSDAIAFTPIEPGAYTVGVAGQPPRARVAVNASVAESDVRRPRTLAAVESKVDPARSSRRVPLAPFAMIAAALALVAAAWFGRGRSENPPPAEVAA